MGKTVYRDNKIQIPDFVKGMTNQANSTCVDLLYKLNYDQIIQISRNFNACIFISAMLFPVR